MQTTSVRGHLPVRPQLTADNLTVRDCEYIRKILLGHKSDPEDRKWTLLGQSYGGWCSFTYLSFYPEGLKEVFLTGGMAGLMPHPDHDYEKLVRKSAPPSATNSNASAKTSQLGESLGVNSEVREMQGGAIRAGISAQAKKEDSKSQTVS